MAETDVGDAGSCGTLSRPLSPPRARGVSAFQRNSRRRSMAVSPGRKAKQHQYSIQMIQTTKQLYNNYMYVCIYTDVYTHIYIYIYIYITSTDINVAVSLLRAGCPTAGRRPAVYNNISVMITII